MPSASDPRDLGAAIRSARRHRRLTQKELARRAGVGRQWLVAVERGHAGAEFGKVAQVLSELGQTLLARPASAASDDDRTWLTLADAARMIRTDIEEDDVGFALRTLARAVADFRALDDPHDVEAFLVEPPSTGDPRWDTLVAACVARECRAAGLDTPEWTRGPPLESWWFPVFDPVLTARTMQRTPVDFSSRGIWLDPRALEVV